MTRLPALDDLWLRAGQEKINVLHVQASAMFIIVDLDELIHAFRANRMAEIFIHIFRSLLTNCLDNTDSLVDNVATQMSA